MEGGGRQRDGGMVVVVVVGGFVRSVSVAAYPVLACVCHDNPHSPFMRCNSCRSPKECFEINIRVTFFFFLKIRVNRIAPD